MIGRTLSHYQIVEKLGEGGMGVVYKARDLDLERFVAIKVLSPEALAHPDRKQRFIQEARAASSLNHPNIITIHEVAHVEGGECIVMEWVRGKTLDHLIGRGGLPIAEALKYAVQIADALAAAHGAGIVHRDLKPGNVMVTESGLVKVLDFGLAKLAEKASGESEATETVRLGQAPKTEEGTILGTVAYMSPEQAEGKKTDARSDIFSFGTMLYEMVSGHRPFRGDSRLSTLSAILREEPRPVSHVAKDVPHDLETIIARSLRKDPGRRFQLMEDVKIALQEIKEESESGKLVAPVSLARRSRRWWLPAAAAAALVLAVGAGWLWMRSREPAERPTMTRLTFDTGLTGDPALSTDGRLLAYASDRGGEGNLDIWVQQVAGGEPLRLTRNPADDYGPDFSPDGSKIAFRSDRDGGGVYVVSALGGEARLIAREGRAPKFSPDGSRIAYWVGTPGFGAVSQGSSRSFVVAANGGPSRQLAPELLATAQPFWADATHVFLQGWAAGNQTGSPSWAAPVDGGAAVQIALLPLLRAQGLSFAGMGCVLERGRMVFPAGVGDSTNLWEMSFSPRNWQFSGPARRLTFGASDDVQPSAASGGRVAFASVNYTINVWSVPLDANRGKVTGELQQVTSESARHFCPSASKDGKKLIYISGRQLRLKDLAAGKESALYVTETNLHKAVLSPDGSRVAYRERAGKSMVSFTIPVSGGSPEKICEDCSQMLGWSFDGRKLLYSTAAKVVGIGLLDPATGEKKILAQHDRYNLWQGQFSPDGRWISFIMKTTLGRGQVFIAPFRNTAVPMSEWIPVTGGEFVDDKPRWSPDGNLMYFTSERDGYRCIWAQRLEAATKKPLEAPFAVYHSHSARRSLMNVAMYPLEISVASDRLMFNLGEATGNIWMMQPR